MGILWYSGMETQDVAALPPRPDYARGMWEDSVATSFPSWVSSYFLGQGEEEEDYTTTDSYVSDRILQTEVRFSRIILRRGDAGAIVSTRMDAEIEAFEDKLKFLAASPDGFSKPRARSYWDKNTDEYVCVLRSVLKVHPERLEQYESGLWNPVERQPAEKEDDWMSNGKYNAGDFVFLVMALETPKQWEQVTPKEGEEFAYPVTVVPLQTVTAKDINAAKKECYAEAVKVEGVDPKRLEVLARPFLG